MKTNKYKFFKNARYAIDGLKDILKQEISFKIELFCIVILIVVSLFLKVDMIERILMISSMGFILVVEAINSAIERVVDMVMPDYHILAKQAKDAGSAAVFITILISAFIWIYILLSNYIF